MSTKIINAYHNNKKIKHSKHQIEIIEKLQKFDDAIGFFSTYQGAYIHGEVGRGKSLIMDLYFNNSKIKKRKRIHFHGFMQEIHMKLRLLKGERDPILTIGKLMAKKVKLLLLDELHIHDIGDAMILSRLFTSLFNNKVFILITSNYHPDELYKDGLQRESFLPVIELIKQKMQVIKISGEVDYRLANQSLIRYFINSGDEFNNLFLRKTNSVLPTPSEINVNGRIITIETAVGEIALCTFEELCAKPLAAADYQAITNHFTTLFLSNVPIITNRNEIKRFIILIDELYEHKTELFCSTKYTLESICINSEFKRTYSRLVEMCGLSY